MRKIGTRKNAPSRSTSTDPAAPGSDQLAAQEPPRPETSVMNAPSSPRAAPVTASTLATVCPHDVRQPTKRPGTPLTARNPLPTRTPKRGFTEVYFPPRACALDPVRIEDFGIIAGRLQSGAGGPLRAARFRPGFPR